MPVARLIEELDLFAAECEKEWRAATVAQVDGARAEELRAVWQHREDILLRAIRLIEASQ